MSHAAEQGSRTISTGILLGAGVVLALVAFRGGLENLAVRWANEEEYGHGFFIPLIAGWLLWQRRAAVVASFGPPAWSGSVLVGLSAVMLVIGELSAIFLLIQLGFVVALAGIVIAVGGTSLLRVVIIPLTFLIFAIPLPYVIDSALSWRLQLLSSELGVFLLRSANVSVYLAGNVIDLGSYKLQVVEACSGLRYLYPFLSLGFLAAYLFRAPLWQRVVVFLSTIPITIAMNSARIAFIGLMAERGGGSVADGFLHFFEGWVVFMACALLLAAEMWLLNRFVQRRSWADAFGLPAVLPERGGARLVGTRYGTLSVAALLLVGAATLAHLIPSREELSPPRAQFVNFPQQLGGWRASDAYLDLEIERHLGMDDYILADYRAESGETVNFYVAYYRSQRKGVSPHSPRVCIPGGGWMIAELDRGELAVVSGEAPFPVNRAVIELGEHKQLVYYWFEERGRRIANEYRKKWNLLVDSILENRSDGALVRLTTPVMQGESIVDANARLQSFMQLVVPQLNGFVPN